jgi:hypothetical protein
VIVKFIIFFTKNNRFFLKKIYYEVIVKQISCKRSINHYCYSPSIWTFKVQVTAPVP